MITKTIEQYLRLPYTRELIPEPEGGWFVRIKELPGCMSQGDSPEQALAMIGDAMRGWLEASLENGDPIPEPRQEEAYSGKFLLRMPRSLHRRLAEAAEEEGVSLNQYINVTLASFMACFSSLSADLALGGERIATPFIAARETGGRYRSKPRAKGTRNAGPLYLHSLAGDSRNHRGTRRPEQQASKLIRMCGRTLAKCRSPTAASCSSAGPGGMPRQAR